MLLDTKPVPVLDNKHRKRQSDFAGIADYGYYASRRMKYYGYKLISLCTVEGIPVVYEPLPANINESLAAEFILVALRGCNIHADKEFIGAEWQARIFRHALNPIYTARKANQADQNPAFFNRWLNSMRERIEGVFDEPQNVGRNIEHLLTTRVIAKMASHLVKFILRKSYGIDVQNFTQSA